jgi:zinc/manganese transport system substrate-binding protein
MTRPILNTTTYLLITVILLVSSCQSSTAAYQTTNGKKTIVVTYSALGAIVKDLMGDTANVVVLIPNGQDPHEWEPSARDIETVNKADLVIQNGLGLEGGLTKTLDQARANGVKFFTASDFIDVRKVGKGEGIPNGSADQNVGAPDPHLWLDPLNMKAVAAALASQMKDQSGIDVGSRANDLENRLEALNTELASAVSALPQANRRLVTGHESMGYFARRYGFQLIGAIVPSLTTQADVSASDMAALKQLIESNHVKAVFSELGTPPAVAAAISQETGAKVVQIATHTLPPDGSYFTFMRDLTRNVVDALR